MNYYSISDDLAVADRWYLGDVDVEDNWVFSYGKRVNINDFGDLKVEIDRAGIPLDFTKTDAFGIPIISEAFAEQLFEYGEFIQLVPVAIEKAKSSYYILVVTRLIDCVDEENSDFEKFEEGNEIRPDKVGEYEAIYILKIKKDRVRAPIFRLAKYDIEIIISEEIKTKLESANLIGLKFSLVS